MALEWLKARARKPGTWGGLIVAVTGLVNETITDAHAQEIAEAVVVMVGIWQAGRTG